jgi:cell division protein FtsL
MGTPEIYFAKNIDNSRLVRVPDPQRRREMRMCMAAMMVFLAVFLLYGWQHYKAIDYGYKIEQARQVRDGLLEENRALHLEEASLRDPERIDVLAHAIGMQSPEAGQVVRMETGGNEPAVPVMARMTAVSVISATQ